MVERFGYVDHRPFGALGLDLVYGRRTDGALLHVSEVPSGLACACACPACGRRLVARKGRKTAHHFAHAGEGGACAAAGETNAHIWAKRVLERTRRILLPAIEAEEDGRKLVSRRASFFAFEDVRLEQRMGEIVPDVVLRAKDRELIVEVWVTHRCDEQKVAKIRERGVSAIEVDLSRLRACADEPAVERALLSEAPRAWLFNPFVETTKQALRQRIHAEEAARAEATRRRARQVASAIRHAKPELSERLRRERDLLLALNRRACFEQPTVASDGFVVPPTMWQAAIFARLFLTQAGQPRWNRLGVSAADVLDDIKDCLAPPLRKPLGRRLAEALQQEAPDLVLPARAVEDYLRRLADLGVLHDDGFAFNLTDQESRSVAELRDAREAAQGRLADTRRRVVALLARLPEAERGAFDPDGWLQRRVPGFERSVSELAASETSGWLRFTERLGAIERMFHGEPPPGHLLGLPLECAAERAREALQRKHKDDRRRQEEAAREAAERRVGILVARTETVLGAGAEAWVGSPGRKSGLTPRQAAEKDDDGLQSVLRALDRIEEQRRRQAEKDRLAADARAELERAARERFPDGHADVFLGSAHPDLGGQRPLVFCEDPVTLRRCMALLPPRRARRAR